MKEIGKNIQLRVQEKDVMREKVHEYMAYKTVPKKTVQTTQSIMFFGSKLTAAFVVAVFVVTTGVGASYASNKALPGDALYTVKQTKESTIDSLLTSDADRAEYAIERVTNRLAEVEALAIRKSFTPDLEKVATQNLERHTATALERIEILAETQPEKSKALQTVFAITTQVRADTLRQKSSSLNSENNMVRERIALAIRGVDNVLQEESTHDRIGVATFATTVAPEIQALKVGAQDGGVAMMRSMAVAEDTMMSLESAVAPNSGGALPVYDAIPVSDEAEIVSPEYIEVLKEITEGEIRTLEKEQAHIKDIEQKQRIEQVLVVVLKEGVNIENALRDKHYIQAEKLLTYILELLYETQASIDAGMEIHVPLTEPEPIEDIPVKELLN